MVRTIASVNARPLNITALLLLTTLVIGYLALTNSNATAGYELRALEQQLDTLREDTRRLELRSLSMQSMDALTAQVADQGFIPVANVRYLTTTDRTVVKR